MARLVPAVSPLSRKDIESHAANVISTFYPDLLREPGMFPVLDFFDRLKDD
jgi:hypothetical protein